jgi:tetratricopeptide (TPR) repeat protein
VRRLFHDNSLGHAYYLTRQYAEAMAALKQVLVRNPDWPPAHIYLAATYSELGRKADARAALAKVLGRGQQPSGEVLPSTDPAVLERLRQAGRRAEEILPYRDPAILERLHQAWHRAMVITEAGVPPEPPG